MKYDVARGDLQIDVKDARSDINAVNGTFLKVKSFHYNCSYISSCLHINSIIIESLDQCKIIVNASKIKHIFSWIKQETLELVAYTSIIIQ